MPPALDLIKASALLGRRVGSRLTDGEIRTVLVQAIAAARPELAERAASESLDGLRLIFDELEYPPTRPREDLRWLDALPAQQSDAREPARVLQPGESLAGTACTCPAPIAQQSDTRTQENTMTTHKDKPDSPVASARAKLAARQRKPLPPLAMSTQLDAKERDLVAELADLIALAKKEGMKLDDLIRALEDLADLRRADAPDEPKMDRRDPSPVATARKTLAERKRTWPKRFGFGSGGDAA